MQHECQTEFSRISLLGSLANRFHSIYWLFYSSQHQLRYIEKIDPFTKHTVQLVLRDMDLHQSEQDSDSAI